MPCNFDLAYEQVKQLAAKFKAHADFYLSPKYQEAEARRDFIDKFVEQMIEASKHLTSVRSDADKDFYENKCVSLDRQIDALVYELYCLTANEIQIWKG
jgi:adenine-specific DNA-methyltransferase